MQQMYATTARPAERSQSCTRDGAAYSLPTAASPTADSLQAAAVGL